MAKQNKPTAKPRSVPTGIKKPGGKGEVRGQVPTSRTPTTPPPKKGKS